jgi:hypothetical protein
MPIVQAESPEVNAMLGSRQKAVLVLGMHRSGTSAFTRILSLLGLDLPSGLMPATLENQKGYWESIELMELHDHALASCGSWWGDWRSIPQDWFGSDECRRFSDRLIGIVRRDFANSVMFVVKDPRICRLAPLWLQTLAQLHIEPLAIITVRHPAEVAASLAVRDGFDPLMSRLLWLRHVLDAERYTRGITRSIVTFDALMSNWRSTVNKIREDLQIEWPVPPTSATAAIEEFLSPSDRHHSALSNSALPPWVASAYEGLLSEAEKDRKRWSPERWRRLHGEVDRADAIFGSFLGLDEAAALRAELQKTAGEVAELTLQKTADEAAALRAELQKTADETAALRAELQKTADEAAALRAELQKANEEVELLKRTAIQRASSIAELTENIRTLEAVAGREIEALKTDREQARNEVSALLNSTSWRITAPLRRIVGFLRG